jgi:hypothetical protein
MQVIQPSKSRKIPLRPFSGMRTPDTTQPDPSGPDTIRSRICYREAPLRVESCVGNASGAGPPDQPNLGLHLKPFSLFDPADHQVDRTLHRFRYPALPWRAPDRKNNPDTEYLLMPMISISSGIRKPSLMAIRQK